jgi:hypothetical protein
MIRGVRLGCCLLGLVLTVGAGACTDSPGEPDWVCGSRPADIATVRTDRHWTAADLPGIGDYVDIHWLARYLGDPCGRAPGPVDWEYQGVLALRAPDASYLLSHYDWQPSTVDTMWVQLLPYVASGARWLTATSYNAALPGPQTTQLYLDPNHDVAYVRAVTT